MAESTIRIQRWDSGVLVEDYTVPKPTEQYNSETITEQAQTALVDNRAFLAITSPTQAQTLAQVKDLTRQNNKIIRMLLQAFDGTD